MKLSAARVDAFVARPDPDARAFLVYGPDAGLVRERADALAGHFVPDLRDPFRVSELAAAQLRDDPARLADEAAALALTGGRRVVRVRDASDAHADVLKTFLAAPVGDAPIIAEAGELGPRSRLRRLFEEAGNAAALPCFADEGATLRGLIEEVLAGGGFAIEPAALDFLESTLGGDRLVTRSELDKLATYMGEERRITLADAEACVGDSSVVTLDRVALAAAAGDLGGLERALVRAYLEGAAPVSILRATARHLQRLHRAAGMVAAGETAGNAVKSFRPPLHFRLAGALRDQLARWPAGRAAAAMDIVLDAELKCKTTGMPAETVCSHALLRVARAAAAR